MVLAKDVAVGAVQYPQPLEQSAAQRVVQLQERRRGGLPLQVPDAHVQRQVGQGLLAPAPGLLPLQRRAHRLQRLDELQRVLMHGRLEAGAVRDAIVHQVPVEVGDLLRERQRHIGEVGVVGPTQLLELQTMPPDEVRAEELVPRGRVERCEEAGAGVAARERPTARELVHLQHPLRLGHLARHVVVDEELGCDDVRIVRNGPPVQLLQHGGQEEVVGVEEGEVVAPRLGHAQVPGGSGRPAPRPGQDPRARLPSDELLEDRWGRVGRPVIDQKQLEVGEALTLDARKALAQMAFCVVHRNDHGHQRHSGSLSLAVTSFTAGGSRPPLRGSCRASLTPEPHEPERRAACLYLRRSKESPDTRRVR